MGAVTVFVDDAVLGRLPAVCAKDGSPTVDRLTIRTPVGDGARLGVAWLLVLAGPIGWIALLFVATSRGGGSEVLTVEVPFSERSYEAVRTATRRSTTAWILMGAGILAAFGSAPAGAPLDQLLLVGGLGAVLIGIVLSWVASVQRSRALVDVRLDASRRWVTLSGVHPGFVAACRSVGTSSAVP